MIFSVVPVRGSPAEILGLDCLTVCVAETFSAAAGNVRGAASACEAAQGGERLRLARRCVVCCVASYFKSQFSSWVFVAVGLRSWHVQRSLKRLRRFYFAARWAFFQWPLPGVEPRCFFIHPADRGAQAEELICRAVPECGYIFV